MVVQYKVLQVGEKFLTYGPGFLSVKSTVNPHNILETDLVVPVQKVERKYISEVLDGELLAIFGSPAVKYKGRVYYFLPWGLCRFTSTNFFEYNQVVTITLKDVKNGSSGL